VKGRAGLDLALLAGAFVASILLGLLLGPGGIPEERAIWDLRATRVALGVIAGAGLATSGAVLQGLTGNPLADPFVLGSSSGAAVGISLARLAGVPFVSPISFLCAGIGAFAALVLAWAFARTGGRVPIERLVLAGIAVTTLGSALVVMALHLSRRDAYLIFSFLVGNLTEGDAGVLAGAGSVVGAGLLACVALARPLDAIALGEEKARTLGVDVERTTALLAAVVAAIVGCVVAVSGMIGFVGLFVPHAARRLVGPGHRVLLAAAALLGGAFLVAVDAIARTAAAPAEFPVGVLTSLLGAPAFLYVLRRRLRPRLA
jgi:iron complex transport system permease protein